jgi:hypothetical protein
MRDEMFDRDYQAARAAFNAGIGRFVSDISQAIGGGLGALHRYEWQAPWLSRRRDARCG